ncbi:MAG TPA: DUF2164 family protein [Candidatus Saccharimonadales bacterium]
MLRKWDISDEQAKRKCVDEVLTRIEEQEGSEFGMIAAQEIIDIVAMHLGPSVHNAAVDDAKLTVQTKMADLEVDLDILKISN